MMDGKPNDIFPCLKDLYAGMVYGPTEAVYRRLLMLLFRRNERRAEEPNSAGNRADLVIDLADYNLRRGVQEYGLRYGGFGHRTDQGPQLCRAVPPWAEARVCHRLGFRPVKDAKAERL